MNETQYGQSPNFVEHAGAIVAAYVSNNHIAVADLPALLGTVHAALAAAASGQPVAPAEEPVEMPTPAQIKKSVQHAGIISFIDGKPYKTMRRHLTKHGLTPDTYRARYGLPEDYPMTAAAYSEQRSNLAKAIGLGVPGARSAA